MKPFAPSDSVDVKFSPVRAVSFLTIMDVLHFCLGRPKRIDLDRLKQRKPLKKNRTERAPIFSIGRTEVYKCTFSYLFFYDCLHHPNKYFHERYTCPRDFITRETPVDNLTHLPARAQNTAEIFKL